MAPSNIKICVRIRPEQGKERASQFREVVKSIGDKVLVFDPPGEDDGGLKKIFTSQRNKDLKFSFDHVFGPESSQLDVYRCTTATILDDVLNGFNSCVFAYGATGAGKTFTMLGNKENPGVIYKTVVMLYTKIDAMSDEFTYDLDVSYVEIYNENIKDLLRPGGKIVLNEARDGNIQLRGVSLHQPKSADELLDMLLRGNTERTQSCTSANSESSRSHAIFQIYLRGRQKVSGTTATWKHSKFSLIDLAGSEKGSVTSNNKQQSEGANINRSLLALGNVINALADRNKNPKIFIPYRDSKLTRLLKDSLGGSCKTIMIANLSPSSRNYEDTYNTLKYANRAKNIKVELVNNVVQVKKHVGEYGQVVSDLKAEVAALNKKLDEKNNTAEKIKLMEDFNDAHKLFDAKCRKVFGERAQLKKELTVTEAEEHRLSTEIKQTELYLRVVGEQAPNSDLHQQIQFEMKKLSEQRTAASQRVEEKKGEISKNMEQAEQVQREIHEYIQHNSAEIPKPLGPELLVQLWEYHLVKVQSYFTENSVAALQEAVAASQSHVMHLSNITEKVFNLLSNKENYSETFDKQIQDLRVELTEGPSEKKKKGGIVWADDQVSDHPTSNLFPSPKLVQPQSPTISFTPGKIPVGSTPQLNKLQAAFVHGQEFSTPASKLQACFNARFFRDVDDSKQNLNDRFNTISRKVYKPILKDASKTCSIDDKPEKQEDLNSTFTLEEPKIMTTDKLSDNFKQEENPASTTRTSKRKISMLPQPSTGNFSNKRKAQGMAVQPRVLPKSPGAPKTSLNTKSPGCALFSNKFSPGKPTSGRVSRPLNRSKLQPRSTSAPRSTVRARNLSDAKSTANSSDKAKTASLQRTWK